MYLTEKRPDLALVLHSLKQIIEIFLEQQQVIPMAPTSGRYTGLTGHLGPVQHVIIVRREVNC